MSKVMAAYEPTPSGPNQWSIELWADDGQTFLVTLDTLPDPHARLDDEDIARLTARIRDAINEAGIGWPLVAEVEIHPLFDSALAAAYAELDKAGSQLDQELVRDIAAENSYFGEDRWIVGRACQKKGMLNLHGHNDDTLDDYLSGLMTERVMARYIQIKYG